MIRDYEILDNIQDDYFDFGEWLIHNLHYFLGINLL